MTYAQQHIAETAEIASRLDVNAIEAMADLLAQVKADEGRIFFLGVGGSAGNCGHAVNDFRKIVGIESYAPTDNVSELTARTNDEGWPTIFVEWLKVSKLKPKDALFIFSVGGGNLEKNISPRRGNQIRQNSRRQGHGRRRTRWRLHRAGGGRLLYHSDSEH
jgi:D-sedoheptulose 7-phosphate isomerase